MAQHPMTKAYIKAFRKAGGKEWAHRFNPFVLDQSFRFGHRTFYFRVQSVGMVCSYDAGLIPAGVTSSDQIVLIPSTTNDLCAWLACDADAKAEFERFAAVVAKTFADYD